MIIDFSDYLEYLGSQKFRSIIICSENPSSLSKFVKKASKRYKGKYIDLLELFRDSEDLSKNIDIFGVEDLLSMLLVESNGQSFLIIDRIDFLLDTWQKEAKVAFFRMVENQWNSFQESMKAILIFCLHSPDGAEDLKILDSQGKSRIHMLSNFKAIG
jgi:hypothetical protein